MLVPHSEQGCKSHLSLISFSCMHQFILLLIKPAVTSPHGCSLEHGTVMLACLYVAFQMLGAGMFLLCFTVIHGRLRGVALGVAYQKPVQRASKHFPAAPAFSSPSSRLMEDNMSCVKIFSVLTGSHSGAGKGIPVAKQRVVAECFCGSGHLPLHCPSGNT